jgi:hypothetical protein
MRRRPLSLRVLPAVLAVLAAGCAPARRAETAAFVRAVRATERPAGDAPAAVAPGSLALDPFLADLPGLAAAAASPDAVAGEDPAVDGLPAEDAALRARIKKDGRGDVSTTFVRRIAVRVAASPARVLREILDVASEKAGLEADEADDLGAPAAGARSMRVALLNLGQKPFQADYRWAFTVRSAVRPDGTILVRYDGAADARAERVSLFLGAGTLVPDGGGTRWVEAFALGSPSSVPFFLKGRARAEVDKVFARRARRLAALAAK